MVADTRTSTCQHTNKLPLPPGACHRVNFIWISTSPTPYKQQNCPLASYLLQIGFYLPWSTRDTPVYLKKFFQDDIDPCYIHPNCSTFPKAPNLITLEIVKFTPTCKVKPYTQHISCIIIYSDFNPLLNTSSSLLSDSSVYWWNYISLPTADTVL